MLALLIAGCGDGGDGGGQAGTGSAAVAPEAPAAGGDRGTAADPPPAVSGERERAGAKAVYEVYDGFAAAVGAGVAQTDLAVRDVVEKADGNESLARVCGLMSADARRQTVAYAKRSAGLSDLKLNCQRATGLLLRRAALAGDIEQSLRAKVIGVNVVGDRATASVRFGGRGPVSPVPLVKEDGEWKLAASPSGGGGE